MTRTAAIVLVFVLLAIAFTWPLLLSIATALDNEGDALAVLCPLYYLGHNIWTNPLELFHAPFYYPHREILRTGYFLFVPAFFFAPLCWLTGSPPAAINILYILTLAMNGVAMYLLVRYLMRDAGAGFVSGFIFAFCPFRIAHFQKPSLMTGYWTVASLLFLYRYFEPPAAGRCRRSSFLIAGLIFYLLQCITDVTTSVYYGIVVFSFIAYSLLTRWNELGLKTLLTTILGVMLLVALLMLIFVPLHINRSTLVIESRAADCEMVQELSSPLSGYLAVPAGAILFGRITRRLWSHPCQINFYGVVAWSLALAGLFFFRTGREGVVLPPGEGNGTPLHPLIARPSRDPLIRVLLCVLVLAFLFSLGPSIYLTPATRLCTGPYMPIYCYARPFRTFASMGAFGMVVLLAVSVLAGRGAKAIMDRAAARAPAARTMLFCALVLFMALEYASSPPTSYGVPFHHVPRSPPAIYHWLMAQDDVDPFIELPMEWEPEEVAGEYSINPAAMYWSIFHGRSIVNGNSDYWYPDYKVIADQMKLFPSRETIDILRLLGVRYIVLHVGRLPSLDWQQEIIRRHPEAGYNWMETLARIEQFRNELVFRTASGADRVYELVPRAQPADQPGSSGIPLPREGWTVTAYPHDYDAALAIDGRKETAWSTKRYQVAGLYFKVDMGRAREITGVEMLSRTASTCPKNPIVEVSENGSDWTSVDYTGAYLDFVRRLLQDQGDTRFRLSFRPIKARYLRATLTRMDNLYPWSIAELEVLGGAGEGRTPTRERGG